MFQGIGRIIYAVNDIESVAAKFAKIGLTTYPTKIVEETGVRVGLIDVGNDTWIELLEGIGEDSAVAKYVQKNGNSLYGISLRTSSDDLKQAVPEDVRTVGDVLSFPGGLKELPIHPKETGLFIILEHGSYDYLTK